MKKRRDARIDALKPKVCPYGCKRHMCEDGKWREL